LRQFSDSDFTKEKPTKKKLDPREALANSFFVSGFFLLALLRAKPLMIPTLKLTPKVAFHC
jgi:preprotein translocase subunit Sec61beta